MKKIIIALCFLATSAYGAAVTQSITIDSGQVISYHVIREDHVLITPDKVNQAGATVPGPVLIFVDSYIDQASFTAGKKPVKSTPLKIQKGEISVATEAYKAAILSELASKRALYLGQIK